MLKKVKYAQMLTCQHFQICCVFLPEKKNRQADRQSTDLQMLGHPIALVCCWIDERYGILTLFVEQHGEFGESHIAGKHTLHELARLELFTLFLVDVLGLMFLLKSNPEKMRQSGQGRGNLEAVRRHVTI
jgi:hypothetical protein